MFFFLKYKNTFVERHNAIASEVLVRLQSRSQPHFLLEAGNRIFSLGKRTNLKGTAAYVSMLITE